MYKANPWMKTNQKALDVRECDEFELALQHKFNCIFIAN